MINLTPIEAYGADNREFHAIYHAEAAQPAPGHSFADYLARVTEADSNRYRTAGAASTVPSNAQTASQPAAQPATTTDGTAQAYASDAGSAQALQRQSETDRADAGYKRASDVSKDKRVAHQAVSERKDAAKREDGTVDTRVPEEPQETAASRMHKPELGKSLTTWSTLATSETNQSESTEAESAGADRFANAAVAKSVFADAPKKELAEATVAAEGGGAAGSGISGVRDRAERGDVRSGIKAHNASRAGSDQLGSEESDVHVGADARRPDTANTAETGAELAKQSHDALGRAMRDGEGRRLANGEHPGAEQVAEKGAAAAIAPKVMVDRPFGRTAEQGAQRRVERTAERTGKDAQKAGRAHAGSAGTHPALERSAEGTLAEALSRIEGQEAVEPTEHGNGETPRELIIDLTAGRHDGSPSTVRMGTGSWQGELAHRLNHGLADTVVRSAKVVMQDAQRGQIEMVIRPPELGRVRIDLEMDNGRIAARILVDNQAVRSVIEDNLAALERAFAEAGLELAGMQVSTSGSDDSQAQEERHGAQFASSRAAQQFEQSSAIVRYDYGNVTVNLVA